MWSEYAKYRPYTKYDRRRYYSESHNDETERVTTEEVIPYVNVEELKDNNDFSEHEGKNVPDAWKIFVAKMRFWVMTQPVNLYAKVSAENPTIGSVLFKNLPNSKEIGEKYGGDLYTFMKKTATSNLLNSN
jgi:hypothetical protein